MDDHHQSWIGDGDDFVVYDSENRVDVSSGAARRSSPTSRLTPITVSRSPRDRRMDHALVPK